MRGAGFLVFGFWNPFCGVTWAKSTAYDAHGFGS